MEIGGYRELDLRSGYEYYRGEDTARLNMDRAGLYHALQCCGCSRAYLPYYECSTVRDFLTSHGIQLLPYHIDRDLRPILPERLEEDAALILVNYLGLLPAAELQAYAQRFPHVIIDNAQAFFAKPLSNAYQVYSPRKFLGVADGCYVIGPNARQGVEAYEEDSSAETSSFLLRRIESGGNANYPLYLESEERLSRSDVRRMSSLTHALLDNIDYESCLARRRQNYETARELFDGINRLPRAVLDRADADAAPMAYPLVIEDLSLRLELKRAQIFVGQWWKYLLEELPADSVECYYTNYLIPIQIDQRYSREHLLYTKEIITAALSAHKGV